MKRAVFGGQSIKLLNDALSSENRRNLRICRKKSPKFIVPYPQVTGHANRHAGKFTITRFCDKNLDLADLRMPKDFPWPTVPEKAGIAPDFFGQAENSFRILVDMVE
jgi:hypothetical protein